MPTPIMSVFHPVPRFVRAQAALFALAWVGATWAQAVDLTAASGRWRLPELGDSSRAVFTPSDEARIGREAEVALRLSGQARDDPEMELYLNELVRRLVQGNQLRQDMLVLPVQDGSINAFAIPGGVLGVNTGLIRATRNESELAAVLAHELAHQYQHHMSRAAEAQRDQWWTALAGVAVAALASRGNSQVGEAAVLGSQALMTQQQLQYTREHEREADRVGMGFLVQAGFDPMAMAAFFEELDRSTRLNESKIPGYLRTHPVNSERIADAQNRAREVGYRQYPDDVAYLLLREQLRLESLDQRASTQLYRKRLKERRAALPWVSRWGLALALMQNDAWSDAEQELRALTQIQPHPLVYRAWIQSLVQGHRSEEAHAALAEALARYPNRKSLVVLRLKLWAEQGNAAAMLRDLAERQAQQTDPEWYDWQAQAYNLMKDGVRQHQALAQMYRLLGAWPAAIDQLQVALSLAEKQTGSSAQTAQISALKSQIQVWQQDAKREKR